MRIYTSDQYLMRGAGGQYLFDEDAFVRGRGIGSIFKNIFTSVVPFVKGALGLGRKVAQSSVGREIGRELKKTATKAGLEVVGDALQGKNIAASANKALVRARNRVGKRVSSIVDRAAAPPKTKKKKKVVRKLATSTKAKRGGGRGGGVKGKKPSKTRGGKKKSKSKPRGATARRKTVGKRTPPLRDLFY